MTGKLTFDNDDYQYPKPLIELGGKTMLERALEPLQKIEASKRFIAIIRLSDVKSYSFDYVIKQAISDPLELITLQNNTKGALCTALLAIDLINNDSPVIISSIDHIIESDINKALESFERGGYAAATICFKSIHPKWSFVRKDENGDVVETAEKRPISSLAIAGFYYFRKGHEFVEAAKNTIRKGDETQGSYYVSSCLNQYILQNKRLGVYEIPSDCYFNFYDTTAIKAFEATLENTCNSGVRPTPRSVSSYYDAIISNDLSQLHAVFSENVILKHPLLGLTQGRSNVIEALSRIFLTLSVNEINFIRSVKERDCTIVEFVGQSPNGQVHLMDALLLNQGQISEINSFYRIDK